MLRLSTLRRLGLLLVSLNVSATGCSEPRGTSPATHRSSGVAPGFARTSTARPCRRARDIFDRPERRELAGTKAKKVFAGDLLTLIRQGRTGSPDAPTFEAWNLREGYTAVAVALVLNGKLGLERQAGKILTSALKKRFSWMRSGHDRVFGHHEDSEAINIDRSGDPAHYWRKDPMHSTAWQARRPDETTPDVLYRGPWYGRGATARLPRDGEFRSSSPSRLTPVSSGRWATRPTRSTS